MNRDAASWERLGARIRAERQRKGLSREELAQQAGVSARSVQSAESGRVPQGRRPFTLDAIERGLGWAPGSIDSILDGGDPMVIAADTWKYDPRKAVDDLDPMDEGNLTRFMVELIRFTHLGIEMGASQAKAEALQNAAVAFIRSFPGGPEAADDAPKGG